MMSEYNDLDGTTCPVCKKMVLEGIGDYRLISKDGTKDYPVTPFVCMMCGNVQLRITKSAFEK